MPDAVRAFVGNFKGPKGEQGPQGIQGPTGPQGIQGPAGPSNADGIDTVDTLGVLVSAGESTDLQRLIDAIADKVMTKLLAKTDIVQVESTATDKVPSSAYIKQALGNINSNLTQKTNTSDFNAFKNMIGFTGLSGMNFGYDGTFVNIWWLFGANKEFGHALNIKVSDGTLQFYNLINGSWQLAWTK